MIPYIRTSACDPEGRVVYSALPAPAEESRRPCLRAPCDRFTWLRSGRPSDRPHPRKASLNFGYPPFGSNGSLQGWCSQASTCGVGEIYDKAQLPQSAVIVMLDGQGTHRPLSRPRSVCGARFHDAPLIRAMQSGAGGGMIEAAGIDGVSRLFAYETLIGARRRGLRRGRSSAGGGVCPVYSQLLWTLGAARGFPLVMVLAWGVGGRLVVSRVRSLVDTVHRLRRRPGGAYRWLQ